MSSGKIPKSPPRRSPPTRLTPSPLSPSHRGAARAISDHLTYNKSHQLSQSSLQKFGHDRIHHKQEPVDSMQKMSLIELPEFDPTFPDSNLRPAKRRKSDEDLPPSKVRSGSASPYSSPRLNHDRQHLDSSGFYSAHQTPLSSPRPVSQHLPSLSNLGSQRLGHHVPTPPSPETFPDPDDPSENTTMLRQPETRPISQEQLVNEVKGIYAGLVMVEKKCVEICQQQAQSNTKLTNEQWQALIALHRTLLHEHHDFFLASQHPTASPAIRRLPTKYAMPARMWRHGIHSFLELLRHRLPHSLEHMLSFVYLAYQMMGLLMESVPAFHETWIECLGDLARYRMAIEENDMRDRETWSNVARTWYNKAADRSPDTGRIQHHLAVLARPNIVCQLFYYSKALVSVNPFPNARDSIMLLFNPLLETSSTSMVKEPKQDAPSKYSKLDSSLVTAAAILFTRDSIHDYRVHIGHFLSELDSHIAKSGPTWKVQGPEVASALIACVLDFGVEDSCLWKTIRNHNDKLKGIQTGQPTNVASTIMDPVAKEDSHRKFWRDNTVNAGDFRQAVPPAGDQPVTKFTSTDEVTSHILPVWSTTISIVASRTADRNILPFLHVTLAFLWSISYVPGALIYLENYVPWTKLALALNTLSRSGVADDRVDSTDFPRQHSGTGRQLPEDFPMRGLVWAPYYFPPGFFDGPVVDEDERTLELPSHAAPRAERCLWLGVRLASLNRYLTYDVSTRQFGCTDLGLSLSGNASIHTLQNRPPTTGRDAVMADA